MIGGLTGEEALRLALLTWGEGDDAPTGARPLTPQAGESMTEAVLRRIAGIILPRRLHLETAGQGRLQLDVMRGVIHRACDEAGDLSCAAGPILARLDGLAEGPVTWRVTPLTEPPASVGLPVSALFSRLHEPPLPPEEVLARFLDRLDPEDAALLVFERGVVRRIEGADSALAPLAAFATTMAASLQGSGSGEEARFILLLTAETGPAVDGSSPTMVSGDGAGAADMATLIVLGGANSALLRFDAGLAKPVADLWRDCLSQEAISERDRV
ncbi:MAG: hypothetical protein JJT81_04840 [Rubellimicrobium sp.]|nr:hypothetical protein [Rubellimicrobium sp.]